MSTMALKHNNCSPGKNAMSPRCDEELEYTISKCTNTYFHLWSGKLLYPKSIIVTEMNTA